jgi:hypothetical protein
MGKNGGRPDLRDLSLLKVEENHAGQAVRQFPNSREATNNAQAWLAK